MYKVKCTFLIDDSFRNISDSLGLGWPNLTLGLVANLQELFRKQLCNVE